MTQAIEKRQASLRQTGLEKKKKLTTRGGTRLEEGKKTKKRCFAYLKMMMSREVGFFLFFWKCPLIQLPFSSLPGSARFKIGEAHCIVVCSGT